MKQQLEQLQNCSDTQDLKALLHSICAGFGEVTRLDVLIASQIGKRQALCFLRMATLDQEQALIRALEIGRFGGDVVVIVELRPIPVDGPEIAEPGVQGEVNDPVARRHFQPTLPMASWSAAPPVFGLTTPAASHNSGELAHHSSKSGRNL